MHFLASNHSQYHCVAKSKHTLSCFKPLSIPLRRQIQACTFLLKATLKTTASPNPSMHLLAQTTLKTTASPNPSMHLLASNHSQYHCVAKSKHAPSCFKPLSIPLRRQIQACTFLLQTTLNTTASPNPSMHFLASNHSQDHCVAKSKHALSCFKPLSIPLRRQIQACTFLLKTTLNTTASPNPSMHFLA